MSDAPKTRQPTPAGRPAAPALARHLGLPHVDLPEGISDRGLQTRAGQIKVSVEAFAEHAAAVEALAEELKQADPHEAGEQHLELLAARADLADEEFGLRRKVHDLLVDLDKPMRGLLDAAQADHVATIAAVRRALDAAGLYPADAEEPRRGGVIGQIIHNHPDVTAALAAIHTAEARLDSFRQRRQANEESARALPEAAKAWRSKLASEQRRQREVLAREERDRRELAKRNAEIKAHKAHRHPFEAMAETD